MGGNMRKTLLVLFFIGLSLNFAQAQIPPGYYNGTQGLAGYTLKTKLNEIITQGYHQRTYSELWDFFAQHDIDKYYENDGTILDIYSENPQGTDVYEYTIRTGQCGSNGYNGEGDCYNREHLMPQSYFDHKMPMRTDVHHIFPSDGYVNAKHGNLPFGEVANPNYTSLNGSKQGPNSFNYSGAYMGVVFEPIDEFKGDIARAYFYMATRYQNQIASWEHANSGSEHTFNGTSDQVFDDWMLAMLLKWNAEDPVSQREIDRNNAAYQFEGNRNPFIDHPEFVDEIWKSDNTGTNPTTETIFYEDFNDCSTIAVNFTAVSELSALNWDCITGFGQGNSGAMQMNAYDNGQVPSIDWLITTNAVNFDNYTDEKLSFYAEETYGNTPLKVLYSTDYDGNGQPSNFTWQSVPNLSIPTPAEQSQPVDSLYTDIDISSIAGKHVYLAFKYDNSQGEDATRWTLDNVQITATQSNLGVVKNHPLKVKIYPNPVYHGSFYIQLPQAKEFAYQLYDLTGRLIQEGSRQINPVAINVSSLSKGLYLLRISAGSRTSVKRVVVQ